MAIEPIPAPLALHTDTVHAEWIDYNGHMMDGYYLVAFTSATEALLRYLGFGPEYVRRTGCTIYTVEGHIHFLRELTLGTPLRFTSQVLGADAKRLHVFHSLFNGDDGHLAATNELMFLHVNQRTSKVEAMPADRLAQVRAVLAAHATLPHPPQAGLGIRTLAHEGRS